VAVATPVATTVTYVDAHSAQASVRTLIQSNGPAFNEDVPSSMEGTGTAAITTRSTSPLTSSRFAIHVSADKNR
jgi:hypothetical protein